MICGSSGTRRSGVRRERGGNAALIHIATMMPITPLILFLHLVAPLILFLHFYHQKELIKKKAMLMMEEALQKDLVQKKKRLMK